jgi:hypothetical protein
MTEEQLKTVSSLPGVFWHCQSCSKGGGTLQDQIITLEKRLEKAECKIAALESFKKETEERLNELAEKKTNIDNTQVTTEQASAVSEMEEREKRKCNLVFYGIKESENENPKERVEEDKAKVIDTLRAAGIQLPMSSVFSIFRAGKKSDKTRPVVVKLSSREKRDEIIKRGREIKSSSNIRVSPDLTPMQRKNLSSLYAEAEEKNKTAPGNFEWRVVGPRDQPRLTRRAKEN